jgi:hypothetical protein
MVDDDKLRHRMQRIADLVQRLDSVADAGLKVSQQNRKFRLSRVTDSILWNTIRPALAASESYPC